MDHPPAALVIDARGHRCPVPTLRLRRALERLAAGDRLTLLADDPMAKIDVPHFLADSGDRLIEARERDGALMFIVERRASATTG